MLLTLQVDNFALLDRLELTLAGGLNVLTGETGAGKSILIDAVGVVLGERASADYIRTGAESARVEAVFDLSTQTALQATLHGLGWDTDDGMLLLAREINRSGKNTCRINGRLATTAMLKDVSAHLVDIHGQHEHQSLLRTEQHLALLDAFGGEAVAAARAVFDTHYTQAQALQGRINALGGSESERLRRQDLLQFQLDEINAARLSPGEEETLLAERQVAANAGKLYAFAAGAHTVLYEGAGRQSSVTDQLGRFADELQEMAGLDARLLPLVESVSGISAVLEDVVREISRYRETLEFEPERVEAIEQRLEAISQLKRKYGGNVAAILAYGVQAAADLDELRASETTLQALRQQAAETAKALAAAAAELSAQRKTAAGELEQKVSAELADLGMPQTRFAAGFSRNPDPDGLNIGGERVAVMANGIDRVEFLLAPNPGEPLRPLIRIASGGELSRIMLALKTVLMAADPIPTLIFDEIDAGVGGRAAQAVARKLAGIAGSYQVLCVTHLPQIACQADAHFAIAKEVAEERTRTQVTLLGFGERVSELARMLSGDGQSAITREHARELLRAAGHTD